jgi:hypothetical protein
MGALYRVLIELNKMCSSTPIVNLPDYFRYQVTMEQCIVKLLLILEGIEIYSDTEVNLGQ